MGQIMFVSSSNRHQNTPVRVFTKEKVDLEEEEWIQGDEVAQLSSSITLPLAIAEAIVSVLK